MRILALGAPNVASSSGHSAEGKVLTDLIVEIFRVNGALVSRGDSILGAAGQSSARWQVMAAVDTGEKTIPGVAREMGLTRQSVQRTADVLVADGLAEFSPNPAHKRSPLLGLTPDGRSVLGEIQRGQIGWSNQISKGWSERSLATSLRVLRDLRACLEE